MLAALSPDHTGVDGLRQGPLGGDEVEWYWQGTVVLNVFHVQLGTHELPFSLLVRLEKDIYVLLLAILMHDLQNGIKLKLNRKQLKVVHQFIYSIFSYTLIDLMLATLKQVGKNSNIIIFRILHPFDVTILSKNIAY